MIDSDELTIFLEKASYKWRDWAFENDGYYIGFSFLSWFCNLDDNMQNRFISYIGGV